MITDRRSENDDRAAIPGDEPGALARWIAPGLVERVGDGWRLAGCACASCDERFFPPVGVCARCLSRDLRPVHLAREGIVHTVTTVVMAPPGFTPPYRLGWVNLADGVRVFGRILPPDGDEPPVGGRVEVTVAVLSTTPEGEPVYGHAFRPVDKEA